MKNVPLIILFCLFIINSCNKIIIAPPIVPGVSLELANHRKETISNINYTIFIAIPEEATEPLKTHEIINFEINDTSNDVQLDFTQIPEKVKLMTVNGKKHQILIINEHLIISSSFLNLGKNIVEVDFFAGEKSLNRNPEYLYTLFVPDRARTAFPIFDQPNLKATYELTLDLPKYWKAIANAPLAKTTSKGDRTLLQFQKSDLISSYLFSFVAGKFEEITDVRGGRSMTMLHRESDKKKVARNIDAIFSLHLASIQWLENYTGIEYPFQKFDFAAIPAFQYGGMEHVGAIQYRADGLFLEEDASTSQLLSRANLIAHETAHMWFGDLVTMDWFNDVWTKEVFANFMAAKIVNPSFPDIDHDLGFRIRSYPQAYSVDRTEGANPIRQDLENLNEAGSLYGAIIYNKAPIMMQQLEAIVGEKLFQEGIQDYLSLYAFDNATWPNLIEILDDKFPEDLKAWSEVWVNTPGRPEFHLDSISEKEARFSLEQGDPLGLGRVWPQSFGVADVNNLPQKWTIEYKSTKENLPKGINKKNLFINSDGRGYGLFPVSKNFLQENWDYFSDLQKGSFFINLYEQLLENNNTIYPMEYIELINWTLEREDNQLLLNLLSSQLGQIYWSLLTNTQRVHLAPILEKRLWAIMTEKSDVPATKKIFFNMFQNIALTTKSVEKLYQIWQKKMTPTGLSLSIRDYTNLAGELAIKAPNLSQFIIETQVKNITNPDRKRRFEFISPSLSADVEVRDAFFQSLYFSENREVESWVEAALGYLHHPLRLNTSEKYLLKSLELLEEIQVTGDIFFPGRWLDQSLKNYQSKTTIITIREFLKSRPDYNTQLKMKILQSADMVFRANAILDRPSS